MSRWVEPFAAALALRDEPGLVLLESMPGFGHLGRRSFVAARPREIVSGGIADMPSSEGWWAGWLSYDLGREIERLPSLAADEHGLSPLALGRYDSHLEFDHLHGNVRIVGEGDSRNLALALENAARSHPPRLIPAREWTTSLPAPRFEDAARKAIDYIRAGDVF